MELRHYIPGVKMTEDLIGRGLNFGVNKVKGLAEAGVNKTISAITGGVRGAAKTALFGVLSLPMFFFKKR